MKKRFLTLLACRVLLASIPISNEANLVHTIKTLTLGTLMFSALSQNIPPTPQTIVSVGDVGKYNAMKINPLGNPVIIYYDGGSQSLGIAICQDLFCQSDIVTQTLDATGNVGYYPSLDVDEAGRSSAIYYDSTNQNLKHAHCHDLDCTSSSTRVLDALGKVGQYTSLQKVFNHSLAMSYYDETQQSIKFAFCFDLYCNQTLANITAIPAHIGHYTSLQTDGSNYRAIAYHNIINDTFNMALCESLTCVNPEYIVDNLAGKYGTLARNKQGFLVAAYTKNDHIILMTCKNLMCTGTNTFTQINGTRRAEDLSLQIDPWDRPLISYYDAIRQNLQLIICKNPMCTIYTFEVLDSIGNVGKYSCLQLDGNSTALVSYYDVSEQDLKLAYFHFASPPTSHTSLVPVNTKIRGKNNQIRGDLIAVGTIIVIVCGSGCLYLSIYLDKKRGIKEVYYPKFQGPVSSASIDAISLEEEENKSYLSEELIETDIKVGEDNPDNPKAIELQKIAYNNISQNKTKKDEAIDTPNEDNDDEIVNNVIEILEKEKIENEGKEAEAVGINNESDDDDISNDIIPYDHTVRKDKEPELSDIANKDDDDDDIIDDIIPITNTLGGSDNEPELSDIANEDDDDDDIIDDIIPITNTLGGKEYE